jgi:redox-sensitive bicupin YhaK (pirin superfamily)
MLWSEQIPRRTLVDDEGRTTELTIIAGRYGDAAPLPSPPRSWASRPESDVAIWTLKLAPRARFTLPGAAPGTNRTLYFFRGSALRVDGQPIEGRSAITLRADADVPLENGADESELLLLQGRPIGEPVFQYGPFVMNTRAEVEEAFRDYRRTQFGGWPWKSADPVHPREAGRFARHADGRVERR